MSTKCAIGLSRPCKDCCFGGAACPPRGSGGARPWNIWGASSRWGQWPASGMTRSSAPLGEERLGLLVGADDGRRSPWLPRRAGRCTSVGPSKGDRSSNPSRGSSRWLPLSTSGVEKASFARATAASRRGPSSRAPSVDRSRRCIGNRSAPRSRLGPGQSGSRGSAGP